MCSEGVVFNLGVWGLDLDLVLRLQGFITVRCNVPQWSTGHAASTIDNCMHVEASGGVDLGTEPCMDGKGITASSCDFFGYFLSLEMCFAIGKLC